ncbi:unnamed protein product [Linum trigynum]|uniref:Gnk2-homologous domain-containing protein n=1 Tax=Linum trigynum TaxID=586398 RepID=A0AAV2E9B1_9ROSI
MMILIVEAKLPNTTAVSRPECVGDKRYDSNVGHLMDFFVDETKNMFRKPNADDYVMYHSYPNRDCAGSVTGVATCYRKVDCWSCLVSAKGKINSCCHHPVGATVELRDCSITFKELS